MAGSMIRWTLAGCMALAALGAAGALDVGSATAEAAPSVSPFAGTYVGADPRGWYPSWNVAISSGGQITSSFGSGGDFTKGTVSGQISADGTYSFTVTVITAGYDFGKRDPRVPRSKQIYTSAGSMASDADGNLVGTADTGGSFLWLRR
jgi:hypothetical protein